MNNDILKHANIVQKKLKGVQLQVESMSKYTQIEYIRFNAGSSNSGAVTQGELTQPTQRAIHALVLSDLTQQRDELIREFGAIGEE